MIRTEALTGFFTWAVEISMIIILAAFVLTVVRLLRGPTLPDRIVALDLFGLLAVAFIALYALWDDQPVFLDAAIALALVGFFGTVAYARFVEKRGMERARRLAAGQPLDDTTREGNGRD